MNTIETLLIVAVLCLCVLMITLYVKKENELSLAEYELFEKRKRIDSELLEQNYKVAQVIEKQIIRGNLEIIPIYDIGSFYPPDVMDREFKIKVKTECGKIIEEKIFEKFFDTLNLGDKILVKIS